ncbi:MAG: hypothetical protein ABFD92_14415 [Planctomycetaceae bacterium]|nr:hypothetical protein [Planctomycetaceae bacterium]
MTKRIMMLALITCLLITAAVYAGRGLSMKCQSQEGNAGAAQKGCGHEAQVLFGGGMFFNQVGGYCRACKKFVYLSWTRDNIPADMKARIKVIPRPAPLGEVWDAQTGKIMTIHACPTCKGPFLEIRNPDELKHCPACNRPYFAIDKSKPELAVD